MYELKKMERCWRVNMLGPGPRLMKNRIYRDVVSQRLRNIAVKDNTRYLLKDSSRNQTVWYAFMTVIEIPESFLFKPTF